MKSNVNAKMAPEKKHFRQAAWQIWLPFALGLLVFLGLCVLAGFAVFGEWNAGANWTAFSVIFWITPSCIGGLLGLALAIGSVVLTAKALGNLPRAASQLINGINKIQARIETLSDFIARPVIKTGSQKAGLKRFWDLMRNKK